MRGGRAGVRGGGEGLKRGVLRRVDGGGSLNRLTMSSSDKSGGGIEIEGGGKWVGGWWRVGEGGGGGGGGVGQRFRKFV